MPALPALPAELVVVADKAQFFSALSTLCAVFLLSGLSVAFLPLLIYTD